MRKKELKELNNLLAIQRLQKIILKCKVEAMLAAINEDFEEEFSWLWLYYDCLDTLGEIS